MFAHDGIPPAPHDFWRAWTFEPGVVALLLISGGMFIVGMLKLRARAGRWPARFTPSALTFGAGWIVLAMSLVSPLHAVGSALFSAHMAQHELIMVLAAPLLVAAQPVVPALWSLPESGRLWTRRLVHSKGFSSVWRVISRPLVAWVLHGAAIWIWHIPRFYGLAVQSEFAHTAQHASFLGTALLFWWTVLPISPSHRNATSLFSVFGTALHTGVLGALLTFSDASWYPVYQGATAPWGLSPLEDQQLGGLIMWIPGGLTYLMVALLAAARLLREPARDLSATIGVESVAA
ncbi:MAG TPA: cytochrome c oxidase assembly protein [Gemmatimonadaceae bacterium]|nr:cytochrome c oxidase assembly protein [Gemmatimonadaceae bacterium]